MMNGSHHQQHLSEGVPERDRGDRTNRFLSPHGGSSGSESSLAPFGLRERAASQPPRGSASTSPLGTPSPIALAAGAGAGDERRGGSPYTPRTPSGLNPNALGGMPQSVPTRSTSFSGGNPAAYTATTVHRGFASTFEDDEFEGVSDTYDDEGRGRSVGIDITRSRSQSLIPIRQPPIGSPFRANAWDGSTASSLAVPSRYADELKPPTTSRYGSLNASNFSRSPPVGVGANDVSNISPFVRDVGQILLDDGSAFRELWAGMHPPRDENGGGVPPGSGTTSRRHSVSVVQPRRDVGFGAPEQNIPDMPSFTRAAFGGRGGLTDDDLAADLGMLSLDSSGSYGHARQLSNDPSMGSLGRTSMGSGYGPLKLAMPTSVTFPSALGSPGESAMSPGHAFIDQRGEASYLGGNAGRAAAQALGARYVPGQGIQYPSQQGMEGLVSSPGGRYGPPSAGVLGRSSVPFAPPMARRASDASSVGAPPVSLADVGKGVPLSAVPASWPLYIVEFKAGRTDLYYCTNLALEIRVGDLVIVEADRGKDLGKVVNDTITHAEVELFQQQQQARAGWGGDGNAAAPQSKEINPKMIYGKASANDAQVLISKQQEEEKALQLCQAKVRQKKLPMEVIDAEYQWDRRKLTFYFIAEKRIDFRELVRELFRLYKTRIWMASLQGPSYES